MGRPKTVEDGVKVDALIPRIEYEYLRFLSRILDMSVSAVIRLFITRSLEQFQGDYEPVPSQQALAAAFARLEKELEANG